MNGATPAPADGLSLPGVVGEFADIYFHAAKLGFTPDQVRGWYVWETAVIFGLHRPDEEHGVGPRHEGLIDDESERLIAARLAAARGEAPPPEAPAYGTGLADAIPR